MKPTQREVYDMACALHEAGRQSLLRQGYSPSPALWHELVSEKKLAWLAVAAEAFEKVQAVALPTSANVG